MIKDDIDVKCLLTNMSMVFSMPTLQKMVKLSIDLEEMFEVLEEHRYQTRLQKLKTFENVLSNLSTQFELEEEKLL